MPVCCGRDSDRARRLDQIGMDKGSGNFWLDCNVPSLRDMPNSQNLALGMGFSKRTSIGELILVRRNDSRSNFTWICNGGFVKLNIGL